MILTKEPPHPGRLFFYRFGHRAKIPVIANRCAHRCGDPPENPVIAKGEALWRSPGKFRSSRTSAHTGVAIPPSSTAGTVLFRRDHPPGWSAICRTRRGRFPTVPPPYRYRSLPRHPHRNLFVGRGYIPADHVRPSPQYIQRDPPSGHMPVGAVLSIPVRA